MKRNLLLSVLALAAVALSQTADAAPRRAHVPGKARRVASLATWTPQTIKNYYWDSYSSEWTVPSVERVTYNDKGQRIARETQAAGMSYRSVYEYYDNGEIKSESSETKQDGSSEWVKERKTVYYYDPIVKDYEIYYEEYSWTNGAWVLERKSDVDVVERDSKNNVTAVKLGWSRYNITYGADGKATKIVFEEREGSDTDPVWTVELVLEDIVWDRTDGQLVGLDGYDPDDDNLFFGPNRIKSAKVANWSHITEGYFTSPLEISVTYLSDGFSYRAEGKADNRTYFKSECTKLDDNGSYEEKDSGMDVMMTSPGQYEVEEWSSEYKEMYDAFGLLVSEVNKEYEGTNLTYQSATAGEVTYGSDGYPSQYVRKQSYDGEAMTNNFKHEYSDNYFSGLGSVSVDNADAPVEYYDLRGVRMSGDELVPGLYIMRRGTAVTKVYVK